MPLVFLTISVFAAVILVIAVFVLFGALRGKGALTHALGMSLFLITVPRGSTSSPQAQEQQKSDKELIAIMEQLYASLGNLHASGWNKFVRGEPYAALEMAVHHVGEEIHFYIAVPRAYEQAFEKQAYGLFPKAQIQRSRDYNIFNPSGAVAGTYLKLTNDPVLPFRTYARLESDPLGGIVTALSKLEREGEGAAIQLLIRPSHRDDVRSLSQKVAREMQTGQEFSKALSLARKGGSKPPAKDETNLTQPRTATAFEEEIIKSLQSKASRPLFDANVRILISAADDVRVQQLLADVSNAFTQFAAPDLNSFAPVKLSGRALDQLVFNYSFRIFDTSQTVLLSSEELASIYHLPLPTTQAPRIKYLKTQVAEPPANLPAEGIVLGANAFRGQETLVRITDEDRRRHLYIIGQTGTGKSSLMKRMVAQDIERGAGVCLVDPHGEFADYALSLVPRERADDVIYFNPGDTEYPLGLNMLEFDPAKPEQKTFIANELLAMVKSLYPDVPEAFGPMFEQYFKNAILLLLDAHQANEPMPTIAEIPRVLTDEGFRRKLLAAETNPLVKNFWEVEAAQAGGEAALANMAPYITSKLNVFLSNDYVRPIVGQPQSAFRFRELMDQRKILIVNLSKGQIGEVNANLLGMMVVSKLLMAALSRTDVAEGERPDFYLYLDEFHNFTTPTVATILSEARKYRLNLTLAHQFVKQLTDDIRNSVLGNVGSLIAFRIGPDDAELLAKQFEPVFSPQDLMSVDNFNAHLRLLINGQTVRPFNIRTLREDEGVWVVAKALKEVSRVTYGRPADEVEDELRERYRLAPAA